MDYIVSKTSGATVLIEERIIDESTNIQLLGMYVPNYGVSIAQTLVRMLENFCDQYAPDSELSLLSGKPTIGQVYYDSLHDDVTFYNGKEYKKIAKDKAIVQKPIEQIPTRQIYDTWSFFIGNDIYDNLESVPSNRQSFIDSWLYDPNSNKIIANNGIQFSGFLTPENSSNYYFEVTVSSDDVDDDDNGSIIAYDDETGDSLSLIVSNSIPTNMPLLSIWYNYNQEDALLIDSKNHDEQFPFGESWNGKSMRLSILRDKNTITVISSKWDDVANLDQSSSMVIKINEINQISSLAKPTRFGFFTNSQPLSSFSDFLITGTYTSNGGEIEYIRRLSTERKIEISGDMTAYDLFDGTDDVILSTSVIRSNETDFFKKPFFINITGSINQSILIDGNNVLAEVSYKPLSSDGTPVVYRQVVDIQGDGNNDIIFKNNDGFENTHDLQHEHSIDDVIKVVDVLSNKVDSSDASIQLNTISEIFNCFVDIPRQTYNGPDRISYICNFYIEPHDTICKLIIPKISCYLNGVLSSGTIKLELRSGNNILISEDIYKDNEYIEGVSYKRFMKTPSICIELLPSQNTRKITLYIKLNATDLGVVINSNNNVSHIVYESNVISNIPVNNDVDDIQQPEDILKVVNVNEKNIIGKSLRQLYNEQHGSFISSNYDIRFVITSSSGNISGGDNNKPLIDTGEFPQLNKPIMISNQTSLYSKAGKGGSFIDNGATLLIVDGEDASDVIYLRTNIRLQNLGRIIAGGGGGAPIKAGKLDENYHNIALTGAGGAGYESIAGDGLVNNFENYSYGSGDMLDERDDEIETERFTIKEPTSGTLSSKGDKGIFFGEYRYTDYIGSYRFTVSVESGSGGGLGEDGDDAKVVSISADGSYEKGKAGKAGKAINTNGYNIITVSQGEIIGKIS